MAPSGAQVRRHDWSANLSGGSYSVAFTAGLVGRLDRQLEAAGWVVQDKKDLNLFAGPGIAVREVVMKPGHGRIDYLLYVDKAVGGLPRIRSKGVAEM
jgi:type I restriction enzyme R subunit